jgi:hypothetical protein
MDDGRYAHEKKGPATSRACKGYPAAKAKGQLDVTIGGMLIAPGDGFDLGRMTPMYSL